MPGNRVTLFDDTGDSLSDNANDALRVNVVAGGAGDGAIQDGVNSAIEATVLDGATANPLVVTLTDANGDPVAVGGGTQYTEDAAAAADPVGTALMMVRDDALSGQTSLDGDNVAARGTDKGELYVKHVDAIPVTDNGGVLTVDGTITVGNPGDIGGGVQYTEGDIDATIVGTALVFEGAADTLVAATGTAANGLDVDVTRVSGTVTVDGSGVTQPVSGTVTANLSATDNAVLDQIELNTDPLLVVGSGVEATAIRVTIATDSTGVLSVDDNGGALTVDGTVTAQGDVGTLDQLDLANTNPLAVAIVDGAGDQITSFGGGTQYTEDAAAAANPVGTALNLVRQDTPATLTTTDGDNVAARGTNYGALYAQIVTSAGAFVDSFGGSGGTSEIDDADFTAATTSGTPAMGVYESTPTNVTDGDLGVVGITTDRRLKVLADLSATDNAVLDNIDADLTTIIGHVDGVEALLTTIDADTSNLSVVGGGAEATAIRVTIANDSTGVLSIDDNGGAITVDGTVSVSGAVDTELTTADLDTGAGTDTRAVVGLVGSASGGGALIPGSAADGLLVNLGANNDVTVAGVATAANQLPDGHNVTVDNASGASAVNIQDGGNSITVDGSLTVDLGANNDVTVTSGTIDVIGTVADDAASPGDPVMTGGQAVSSDGTDPTSVAEGDTVRFRTDLNRRLYVATNHPRTWRYHLNTSTAQTDTQIQAAPGAGLRVVITNIQFTSGAATAINLFLEESTTNIWGPIYLEAVAGRGYVSGPIFLPITANTAVTYTTSAAIAQAIDILGFIEAV